MYDQFNNKIDPICLYQSDHGTKPDLIARQGWLKYQSRILLLGGEITVTAEWPRQNEVVWGFDPSMLRWGSLVVDKSFESLCFNLEPHSTLSLSAFTVLFRFQTNQPVLLQLPSPTLPLPNQTHISIFNQKELKAEDVMVSLTKERKGVSISTFFLFLCPT